MTISAVRSKLAAALETISGLRVYEDWPGQIAEFPAAIIRPMRGDWNTIIPRTARRDFWQISIYATLSGGIEQAQQTLEDYLETTGAKSIKTVIEDYTLYGSVCSFARIISWSEYGGYEFGGVKYLGVKIDLETW